MNRANLPDWIWHNQIEDKNREIARLESELALSKLLIEQLREQLRKLPLNSPF